ncbi:MAG: hypothetical protein ACRBF0_06530 [Calditrichia bacterium]
MKDITIYVFLIALIASINLSAQVDSVKAKESVHSSADKLVSSFMAGDYKTFTDLTHPTILSLSGGQEAVINMLAGGLEDITFLDIKVSPPEEIFVEDNIVQCVMNQREELVIAGDSVYTNGSLIGISYDSGESWSFIGVAKIPFMQLQTVLPELNDDLDVIIQSDPMPLK